MIDKFKTGNPIWVYYNDIDSGANLTVPQLLRGFIGQEYQIEQKQFPNYRYVKTEGETKGTFDMRQRIVHLFYRKQNWGEVQSIEMYLHLDAPTQVFDTAGGMPVGAPSLRILRLNPSTGLRLRMVSFGMKLALTNGLSMIKCTLLTIHSTRISGKKSQNSLII